MEYAEKWLEIYRNIWFFSGIAAAILLTAAIGMAVGFRIPTLIRKRRWILVLACILACQGELICSLDVQAEEIIAGETADKREEEKEKGEIVKTRGVEEAKEKKEADKGAAEVEIQKETEETKGPEELEESEGSGEPEESEGPEKPEEPEDITAPEISAIWRDEYGKELEGDAYYQTGEELTMELSIKEENPDAEEIRIYLKALDASGKSLDIPEIRQIHGKTWEELKILAEQEKNDDSVEKPSVEKEASFWELQEEPGLLRLKLHLKAEANYQISAYIWDKAGNVPKESAEGYVVLGSYCLDRTVPWITDSEGITLSAEHQTIFEKLINQVTFGYFCQPELTVKVQACDSVSGVGGITYVCEGIGGEIEPESIFLTKTVELGEGLIYEDNGMRAYTTFSLPSSFQGTIKAKAWDRVEITMEDWAKTKGILIESEEMHKKTSHAEVFLEGTPGGRGSFYRENVELRFVMEDTFSGIRSARLKAGNQEAVLTFEEEGEEIQRKIEHNLVILASEHNQNQIPISAYVTDFAGHSTELTTIPDIHIDTEPPIVEVEWLNQDVRNEKYYQADQAARITVRERNFVPNQVELALTGMDPADLIWTHHGGEGCSGSSDPESLEHSDSCTWVSELVFDKDGEYSFGFSCQDAAGNRGSYEKTDTFVIDKTPPVLLVHWDDSEASHEHYYSKERSAVLEIQERNLRPEDLKTSVEASLKGEDIPGPELGALRQWEEEDWRAGITFQEDGRFQWEVHCVDLAGNEAEAYCSEEFVIDRTPPELIFEGVEDCSANQGAVMPKLKVTDTNFDPEQTSVSLKGSNGTGELPAWVQSQEEYGFTLLWGDFEQLPENDDLYRIKAKAGDLAGNTAEAELTFSVNRFGSVYELEEATALLAGLGGSRYASREPELVITEYNPDFLNSYQVTSNREGETVELKEGRDYQVEKRGTKDSWKTYQYRIGKENFQKEGIYLVTLYSEDQAKNASNNRVKGKSLEFIVDKTGPSIVVTGVEDQERIQGSHLEIQADIRDIFALAGAQIYLNGQCVADYDREKLQELNGMLTYSVPGAKVWQTFAIKAWDEAGNQTEMDSIRFLVTEQIRFQLFADDKSKVTWIIVSIGLLVLAGAFLVAAMKIHRRFRKKDSLQ